jgi:hypothetical protein
MQWLWWVGVTNSAQPFLIPISQSFGISQTRAFLSVAGCHSSSLPLSCSGLDFIADCAGFLSSVLRRSVSG